MSESKQDQRLGVLMLSGDLMFASRVKGAAQAADRDFSMGGSLPEGDLSAIRWVVLDLSTRSKLTDEIADRCAQRCPAAKLIAYGPHVHVDKLKAARAAGIAHVLTNGQMDVAISTLFAQP